MSERGIRLLRTADGQVSELIALFSDRDASALNLPCPRREKLGDGSVGALAAHTADNYLRIAGFLQSAGQVPDPPAGAERRHRTPRWPKARGHARGTHAGHGQGTHDGDYAAQTVDLPGLLERLSSSRDSLSALAELTDGQLDSVPPASDMRFCDGQRTLEQVLTSLLRHQSHQVDALRAALA